MNIQRVSTRLIGAVLTAAVCASPGIAGVLTFYPTDDTFVKMKSPEGNYGSSESMMTENRYGHPTHPTYWQRDVLVRFDLSSIPSGTDIPSATLELFYYEWHDNNPAGRNLTCYRITAGWDEDTVTWATQPGHALQPTCGSIVPSSPGAWMSWDVTSDVQAFVNGEVSDFGWQIKDEEPWGWFNIPWTEFRSKEFGAFTPYLAVVPEPATLSLVAVGIVGLLLRRRSR